MSIRLIALDIDGTLLNSAGEISPENLGALEEARARGIELVLVTGRRYDFARAAVGAIEHDFALIASNGAIIRSSNGKTHLRRALPRAIAREVLEASREYREGASVVFDRPRKNQVIYESLAFTNPLRRKYYEANREFISAVSPLEKCLTEDPLQLVFTGPVDEMRRLARAILPLARDGSSPVQPSFPAAQDEAAAIQPQGAPRHLMEEHLLRNSPRGRFAVTMTEYPARDFTILDVLHRNCTKGIALEYWARQRRIPREEIMAIGDNWNDLEMLDFAGLPVVMGNAAPSLNTYATSPLNSRHWRVTLANDESGVAAAIHEHALNR